MKNNLTKILDIKGNKTPNVKQYQEKSSIDSDSIKKQRTQRNGSPFYIAPNLLTTFLLFLIFSSSLFSLQTDSLHNCARMKYNGTSKLNSNKKCTIPNLDKSLPKQKKQQKELLKGLSDFIKSPLDPSKSKLANIVLTLLSGNNDKFVFTEIEKWWNEWLKTHKLDKPDEEMDGILSEHVMALHSDNPKDLSFR